MCVRVAQHFPQKSSRAAEVHHFFLSRNCHFGYNSDHLLFQVVERIKANPRETKLLVIEESGDIWYKAQGLVIKGSQANVIFQATPERRSEKEEDECAAVVLDDETVSGESGTDEEGQAVAGVGTAAAVAESSGANDCVRNESEEESAFSSPSSHSPSSVSTELKNRVDSKDEKVEESEAVPMQSQAAVEPEIVGSDSPAGVVVAAVTSSGDSGSLLQDRQEKADASTGAAVADQKEDLKEAEAEPRGVRRKNHIHLKKTFAFSPFFNPPSL